VPETPDIASLSIGGASAKVRRLDVLRFTAFQLAAPVAIAAGIAARRTTCSPVEILACGLFAISFLMWWRSYKRFGRQVLLFRGDHFVLLEDGDVVRTRDVKLWAADDRDIRVYSRDERFVWLLGVDATQLAALCASLTKMCGRPWRLVPRGSRLARAIGGAMGVGGLGLVVVAFSGNLFALVLVGILLMSLGFSSYAYSSLRVVRPPL
jgi:hypothetical protein